MVNVLFICLGNICRSPMSEAYMRHIIKQNNLSDKINVSSRATSSYNVGNPPHHGTQTILNKLNIDFSNIISKKLTEKDLSTNDYIIVMDDSNMRDVTNINPNIKIHKLTDFIKNSSHNFVPDPYYTGDFNLTFELIKAGCDSILEHIINDKKL